MKQLLEQVLLNGNGITWMNGQPVCNDGHSLIQHAASTGNLLLSNNISLCEMFNPLVDRLCASVNAMLLVPIRTPVDGGCEQITIHFSVLSYTLQDCLEYWFLVRVAMGGLRRVKSN